MNNEIMVNPKSSHQESYRIRRIDCDRRLQLRPATMFAYFQECGFGHCRAVGLDADELIAKGYAWYFIQIRLTVDRYPMAYETTSVRTWPSLLSGIRAVREFEMIDDNGRVCASATSRWLLIDLERGRPVRIPSFIEDAFSTDPARAVEHAFPRLSVVESPNHFGTIQVRLSDLDLNNHANTGVYFDWLMEGVDTHWVDKYDPIDIEILFRQEASHGDAVQSSIGPALATGENFKFEHCITRDDTVLAVGTSSWRPRPGKSARANACSIAP